MPTFLKRWAVAVFFAQSSEYANSEAATLFPIGYTTQKLKYSYIPEIFIKSDVYITQIIDKYLPKRNYTRDAVSSLYDFAILSLVSIIIWFFTHSFNLPMECIYLTAPFIEEYYNTNVLSTLFLLFFERMTGNDSAVFHIACCRNRNVHYTLHLVNNILFSAHTRLDNTFSYVIAQAWCLYIAHLYACVYYEIFWLQQIKPDLVPVAWEPKVKIIRTESRVIKTESCDLPSRSVDAFDKYLESTFTREKMISRLNLPAITDISDVKALLDKLLQNVTADVTDFALSLISLFYKLFRLRDISDLFVAAFDFIRSVFPRDKVIQMIDVIKNFLVLHVTELYKFVSTRNITTESKPIDMLKSISKNLDMTLSSELVTTLRNFVLTLVGFKLFNSATASKITGTLGVAQKTTTLGLMEITLASAITVMSFYDRYDSGMTFSEILSSEDPVTTFTKSVESLEILQDMTYSGLPVDGKVCVREYMSDVKKTIIEGKTILDGLPRMSTQRISVERSYRKIRLIESAISQKITASIRPMPFCVALEGAPGIGKGLLIDYVGRLWSHVKDRPFAHSHVYHRNAGEEYWSGYEPLSQPIIHYSEPGCLNRNIAKARGDPVITEFLSVCDNQPYSCNMADLDSKGNVFVRPELCLIDCNDPGMNLEVLLNNPAAARRRILYVHPEVKPEYKVSGSCRLDVAKSLASSELPLDRWLFTVYVEEPESLIKSNKIYHLRAGDIFKLTDTLKTLFKDHIVSQEKRLNLGESINVTDYCSVATESATVEPLSETAPIFVEEEVDPNFYLLGSTLDEISCAFCTLMWYNFLYLLWTCSLMMVYVIPNALILKLAAVRSVNCKRTYYADLIDRQWIFFMSTMGFETEPIKLVKPSYNTGKYIAAFSALLLCFKFLKTSKAFTEGAVISSSKERSEEEVDEFIQKLEETSECNLPEPRKKLGNGIDWDANTKERPMLEVVSHETLFNLPEEIRIVVLKNKRFLRIFGEKQIITHCFGICKDYVLVNRHSFGRPNSDDGWIVEVQLREDLATSKIKVLLDLNEMKQVDGDVWLVRLRGCKFRDITSFLSPVSVMYPPYGGKGHVGDKEIVLKNVAPLVAQNTEIGPIQVNRPLMYDWPEHETGKCGTPIFGSCGLGYAVVALHIAGSTNSEAYAQTIDLTSINRALDALEKSTATLTVNSQGKVRLNTNYTGIEEVSERSPLRFEDVSSLSVYGKIKGYSPLRPGKSKLERTQFIDVAELLTGVSPYNEAGEEKFLPPPMRSKIVDGEYKAPYNNFVKNCGVVKETLNPKILKLTVDTIFRHITSELQKKGVKTLKPIPLSVAQNGFPEDFYMRAMKPSTSGGFTWPGAKKKYSEPTEVSFKKDAYMPLYDVKEQVMEQVSAYLKDEDAVPLLGAQLKDEPRSLKKVRDAKTRVFCMSPYESTLVNRMYLMPFYSLMVEHGDIFHTAIGINMHSTDVEKFLNELLEFSKQFMEGDYRGFDTSMPYDIGLAANTIIYLVVEFFGYNQEALQITKGALSDNLHPTVVLEGDLFAAPSLQPSGKYATAEDNSLRGLVMLVYSFISMCTPHGDEFVLTARFQPDDFWLYIRGKIYGDDLLAAVKIEAQPYFNNQTYQNFCKKVYGLDFTNALKTDTMEKFLQLNEISFLKRTFVFRKDIQKWVAPLDRESIMKSICYVLPSKSVTRDEQLIDSCVSALRELFFHLRKDDYAITRANFALACAKFYGRNQNDIFHVFPDFASIYKSIYNEDLVSAAP